MTKELEEVEYYETLVDFNILCQQQGCRKVLFDLHMMDRAMFEEMKVQINRIDGERKIPYLER